MFKLICALLPQAIGKSFFGLKVTIVVYSVYICMKEKPTSNYPVFSEMRPTEWAVSVQYGFCIHN